jgi:MtN3 and saliva related transmembrane protein
MTEALGFVAAACTTLAFLPQVIYVWRRRSADDISLSMYLIMLTGVALWIAYGLRIHSVPLVAANVATLALAGGVLAVKLYFRTPRR